ncbi:hypothetical protein J008_04381 [Cryptococcus neoformans]|nr:hypothetical protein C362_03913 [Cryptococcus neoformans var. grubii Bt1]OWZ37894.1 hypothetical protein C356_04381 [Cryptococcus neoformans var. grubii c45]OWZ61763.1 hypothetical protein AYX15_06035 [Cryptococcus neoformans var. grubii]OWZ75389.1 hypothetical protein C365_05948 [Cryptococcus neoformans var. grubii Bt85]OXC60133.1 hypothetical protein C358_04422 [Cryptococcus neoformans var. grubii MW-RSA852]OXG15353.1 hypothetical protein C366_04491 [Cryptococcus neoformans var. grubii Tu
MSQATDAFWQPFSSGALKLLPKRGVGIRAKSKRADRIPDDPQRPLVTDYHSINDPAMRIRVPKKFLTPVKVEAKVWFANERTFISYLSMGLLLSTIASGLLFGSRDSPARWFAFAYALISAGVLIYGWAIFQKRLTMISARDSGNFDLLWGPIFICFALFIAILANFIFRLHEAQQHTGFNPLSFKYAWNEAAIKSS